jgi:hypothetical protein
MKVGNMECLTKQIQEYFQSMQPGERITVAKAKDPAALISATKEYIDAGNPDIEFNNDYTQIKKLHIWA